MRGFFIFRDNGLRILLGLFVFDSIRASLDLDKLRMVGEPVDDGRGRCGVVEYLVPVFKRPVGGQNDAATFIPGRNDLEEEVRALAIEGQVTNLIAYQKPGRGIGAQGFVQLVNRNGSG